MPFCTFWEGVWDFSHRWPPFWKILNFLPRFVSISPSYWHRWTRWSSAAWRPCSSSTMTMLDWRMSSRLNRWQWLKLKVHDYLQLWKFCIKNRIVIWPHVIWSNFTFTRWSRTFLRCWRSTQGCNNHINITAILKFMLEIVIHCEIFAPRLTKYLLKETFAPTLTKYLRPGWQRAMTFGLQSSCCSCPSCAALGWNHPGLFSATRPPSRTTSGNVTRLSPAPFFKTFTWAWSCFHSNKWAKVKTGLVSSHAFTQSFPVGSWVKKAWK